MSSETHSREISVCPAHPYFLPSYRFYFTNGSIGEEAVPNYGRPSRIDRSSGNKVTQLRCIYAANLPYSSARTYRIRRFQLRCLFPPPPPSPSAQRVSLRSLNNETPEKWVTSLVYGVRTNPYLVWISSCQLESYFPWLIAWRQSRIRNYGRRKPRIAIKVDLRDRKCNQCSNRYVPCLCNGNSLDSYDP